MPYPRATGAKELIRGLLVDRRSPDLEALAREQDPERFVWRSLPHAARSFATSIVVLPPDRATAAAVAYLYCRMLDTYEDLLDDPQESVEGMRAFASRFDRDTLEPPPSLAEGLARDPSDELYLLLLRRCEMVDSVYAGLPARVRSQIRELVGDMASGMIWSVAAFSSQGGVLTSEEQLSTYCRHVIGHPAIFVINLIGDREVTEPIREDTLLTGEMIQLANVSRDIERDLSRGIAYHPALKPHLGSNGYEGDAVPVVRDVREELLGRAMTRAPAYRRLFDRLGMRERASTRTAAVLMLLFTDLHYRSCAVRTGHQPWPGPSSRLSVIARSLPALLSPAWAASIVRAVEANFRAAAVRLGRRDPGLTRPRTGEPAAG